MSIQDLMSAVRNGEFEKHFQSCESAEQKIELFKEYGIVISLEDYKNIELKVRSIKQGTGEAYDALEKEVEGKPQDVSDKELQKISAGIKAPSKDAYAVFSALKYVLPAHTEETPNFENDDDMKINNPPNFF